MEATNRLNNVQAALTERGVRDVKFFFDEAASSQLPSTVKAEAAYLLEQYLAGKYKEIDLAQ